MAIEVKFKKDTNARISSTTLYPLVQGQLLFATDTEDIYQDVVTSTGTITRISKGGNISTEDYSGGGTSVDAASLAYRVGVLESDSVTTTSSTGYNTGSTSLWTAEETYTNLELTQKVKALEETVLELQAKIDGMVGGN